MWLIMIILIMRMMLIFYDTERIAVAKIRDKPIGLDQPFEFDTTEVDFDEDDIANDEIVPVSDDDDHEVAGDTDNESDALSPEEGTGSNFVPSLKRKPRM